MCTANQLCPWFWRLGITFMMHTNHADRHSELFVKLNNWTMMLGGRECVRACVRACVCACVRALHSGLMSGLAAKSSMCYNSLGLGGAVTHIMTAPTHGSSCTQASGREGGQRRGTGEGNNKYLTQLRWQWGHQSPGQWHQPELPPRLHHIRKA